MAGTTFTSRLIVVVRPAVAAAANTAAKDASVDQAGGEKTWTVPLRQAGDATNAIVAYWCCGVFKPAQVTALRSRLQSGAGMDASDVALVGAGQKGSFAPRVGAKAYVFDATLDTGWTPAEVLAALNLDHLAGPRPGS